MDFKEIFEKIKETMKKYEDVNKLNTIIQEDFWVIISNLVIIFS